MKNRSLISLAAVLTCLCFQILLYFFGKNSLSIPELSSLVKFGAFVSIIFLFPDYLEEKHQKPKWFQTSAFYTIILLLFLALLGLVIGKDLHKTSWVLILWCLFLWWHSLKKLTFSLTNALTLAWVGTLFLFMILTVYSVYHRVFFLEKILQGTVHIDVLLHAAISNAINTFGYASTGIDGATLFKYHWGSHALLAGLSNLCGMSVMQFYNLGYSILFVPLFIKSIWLVVEQIDKIFSQDHLFFLFFISFFIIYFSLDRFTSIGQPIGSESYTISLIFSFLLIATLVSVGEDTDRGNEVNTWSVSSQTAATISIFIFSSFIILVVFFTKISTGAVLLGGLAYLYLRKQANFSDWIKVISAILIIIFLVYHFIFPIDRTTTPDSLIHRYGSLWRNSEGIFDYWTGIIILIFVLLYKHEFKSFSELKTIFKSKQYLPYEVLAVIAGIGFLGGISVSSYGNDVAYFSGTQLYFCMPVIVLFLYKIFIKAKANRAVKMGLLAFLSLSSIFSKPEIGVGLLEMITLKKINLSESKTTYAQFLMRLIAIEKEGNKQEKCIYILPSQQWFYGSQKSDNFPFRDDIEASFVVPAVAGVAIISGISQRVLDSNYPYYGVYYHKKHRNKQAQTLEEAIQLAKSDGFKTLIYFEERGGKLVEDRIDL
jgi:hypothetical protein